MRLTKLSSNCEDRNILEAIHDEAFPPKEWVSMEDIFQFAQNTNTDIIGICESKNLIGYMVLVKNELCGYLYFFAIGGSLRSKGYGSRAMQELLNLYPQLQIVLDFEPLEATAPNLPQRKRRREFYLRNGFHETGYFTMLREDRFEVVCSGGELQKEAVLKVLKVIHKYRPEFPDALF